MAVAEQTAVALAMLRSAAVGNATLTEAVDVIAAALARLSAAEEGIIALEAAWLYDDPRHVSAQGARLYRAYHLDQLTAKEFVQEMRIEQARRDAGLLGPEDAAECLLQEARWRDEAETAVAALAAARGTPTPVRQATGS